MKKKGWVVGVELDLSAFGLKIFIYLLYISLFYIEHILLIQNNQFSYSIKPDVP